MAADLSAWADCLRRDDAVNLIVLGADETERAKVVADALMLAPGVDHARLLYGEVASATARDSRLLLGDLGADRWSRSLVERAMSVALLVIEDFGAGTADYYEVYGLKNLFDHRRQSQLPIIASSRYSHDELFHIWNVGATETVLAEQALWRLFNDAVVVQAP